MSKMTQYVVYDEQAQAQSNRIREAVEALDTLLRKLPDTRPVALARTKLEESFMWAGKAIRDDQLERERG